MRDLTARDAFLAANELNSFSGGLAGTQLLGIYSGGSGDGHDRNDITVSLNGFEISGVFSGGPGDGHVFDTENVGLDGQGIAGLYTGGAGDGHIFESENVGLNGQNISGLYGGGSGDGYDKVTGQFVIKIPDCRFVINGNDDGFGSLRYAISCAQPGDTVTFSPGMSGDTVLLTSQMLKLEKSLAIKAGDAEITVNAESVARAFGVVVGYQVVISGLHIVVGQDTQAAGIDNDGFLTLIDVTIVNPNGLAWPYPSFGRLRAFWLGSSEPRTHAKYLTAASSASAVLAKVDGMI